MASPINQVRLLVFGSRLDFFTRQNGFVDAGIRRLADGIVRIEIETRIFLNDIELLKILGKTNHLQTTE